MRYQLIMKRSLEPDGEPDITRGTLEGDLQEGSITFFRLQYTAAGELKAYVAQGEILPVPIPTALAGIGAVCHPRNGAFLSTCVD